MHAHLKKAGLLLDLTNSMDDTFGGILLIIFSIGVITSSAFCFAVAGTLLFGDSFGSFSGIIHMGSYSLFTFVFVQR